MDANVTRRILFIRNNSQSDTDRVKVKGKIRKQYSKEKKVQADVAVILSDKGYFRGKGYQRGAVCHGKGDKFSEKNIKLKGVCIKQQF